MPALTDLAYAARALRRQPGLIAIATVVLAIGIAANSVMFGVVNQLLLQPPAQIRDPGTLRRIYYDFHRDGWMPGGTTTYPMIAALQRSAPSMDVAAYSAPAEYTLGAGPEAQPVEVQLAGGNFFGLLGVQPALGRFIGPDEDRIPDGEPVAVLSHGFWRSQLGASTAALGRTLVLDGRPFTVIGVAPPEFSGVDRTRVDIWIPISAVATQRFGRNWHDLPHSWWVQGVGRLRDGASPELAAEQATTALRSEFIRWNRPDDTVATVLLGSIVGARHPAGMNAEGKVSVWLLGVSMVVLLIACANVANLLISRTMQRRREIAVLMAMGAGRARLVRLLLAESALLATGAAILASALALAGGEVVRLLLLEGIVWDAAAFDARTFGVTLGAAVLCVILAGVAPALQGTRISVAEGLRGAAGQVTTRSGVFRHGLLAVQAALSMVLLIGAGLFVRSLDVVLSRDVGVDLDRAVLVTAGLDRAGFSRSQIEDVYQRAQERISAMPGVDGAAVIRQGVPTMSGHGMSMKVPGLAEHPELELGGPYYSVVPANYFATIGTRILRGRAFTPAEDRSPARVMVINKLIADAYWPGQDPVGQCARLGSDSVCTEVVGVVGNAMLFRLVRDERGLLYLPPGHPVYGKGAPAALVFRVSDKPGPVIESVRREIQSLAPNMPYTSVETFSTRVAWQLRPWRLGATMFTIFGVVALVIAAVGLYSVMAYSVSQRTREIGVRMALGARTWDVVRLVTWQSTSAVLIGLAAGATIAALAARWAEPLLFETSPRDPLIYLVAGVTLALAAAVASIVPGRRSARVDPVIAMRSE